MAELSFPSTFLWGAATAAHQVEGDNVHSDWWAWENMPASPAREPSGRACEHYTRYAEDLRLLADLGLNSYRFSVEWARIEPEPGRIDDRELAHYRAVADTVRETGMTPVVTLNHFTLPAWLGRSGGWLDPRAPQLFAGYCTRVTETLGERVTWYATINEPGSVALGGYLGALGFPPRGAREPSSWWRSGSEWERSIRSLVAAHVAARRAIRAVRPQARVGQTFAMVEWLPGGGGTVLVDYLRRMMEDVFLEASADDDWVGVQAYTRQRVHAPAALTPLLRLVVGSPAVRRLVIPAVLRAAMRHFGDPGAAPAGTRTTQMGYEFWPEAIAATVRRAAELLPGKPLLVTEHGVATADDAERVEFITRGLTALHSCLDDGLPLIGYLHWSALDNFEWALGYRPRFGLIGVDRATMARTVRPSARFLGQVARAGMLPASPPAVDTP